MNHTFLSILNVSYLNLTTQRLIEKKMGGNLSITKMRNEVN